MIIDPDQPNYKRFGEIVLVLDQYDYHAVASAIRHRLGTSIPDGDGNHAGRVIAEICRGWMEMLGRDWSVPAPTTPPDGKDGE